MNAVELKSYLLDLPGASETFPFGPDVSVMKVGGKVYALCRFDEQPLRLSLKCDPDEALTLREMYSAVQPGYHLNKEHWNTVTINGSIPDIEIHAMIDHSYALIFNALPKRIQKEITK
jgi:predicted DNA-binding protein (MmcQ/YjbR family)